MAKFLFLHPVFPGQFHKVMEAAVAVGHQVVHGSRVSAMKSIEGVTKARYQVSESEPEHIHPFARRFDENIRHAQAVLELAQGLKAKGFVPDLVYAYGGWGPAHFMKDIFPDSKLACYFEWFLNVHGAEYNFDPANPLPFELQTCLRAHNAGSLIDLESCDFGVSPTAWQRQQYPAAYREKIQVIHDGVDTEYFAPSEDTKLVLPEINLDLSGASEIVTYVARGFEPFRGFPQFMRALKLVQEARPNCHTVLVGNDEVYYSKHPPEGSTYRQMMLDEVALDMSRVHFTGWLSKESYRRVLQCSSAHIYLTIPYILSWSLMDALASECLLVGSRTAPVEEAIVDGQNGLLVDMLSPEDIARGIIHALENQAQLKDLRKAARKTVLERYDYRHLVPEHLKLLEQYCLQ